MNHIGKEKDTLEMTRIIRKAKRKSTFRSVIISLMVTVIVLFGVMIGNVQLVNWSSSRAMNEEFMMEEISGPNLTGAGYTDEQGFLSGILEFHKVKVIEGVPITWASKKVDYQAIPFFAFTALGGSSTEPGITLPDAEMKKEGYEYTRAYNSTNGQRKMLFYIPQVDYNEKILNDLSLLQEMDQNKLLEMAISFDQDYTLSEVKQMIPAGLTQTWYWVDTYSNKDFYKPYIDGNGNQSYATPHSEDTVRGFGIFHADPNEVSEQKFLDALEWGVKAKGRYHYELSQIYDYLKKDKAKPDATDVRILGVVVTGSVQEFHGLRDQAFVRGVTLGSVVEKY
ncbi:anti sigma factor C-terminal domain-containing protein [Paenibacillus bouchesdurhonensis]|uniref:anti sigma factor C-terminal domain-containing protein n=1 Tax=Paenibacillus bouchesdurhonensis TaxID=1870990 RepID=UPI0019016C19|nr:anti sigma factor C-terminal domain-containing protein [Paenibacillus bouchesdurhonensis]